VHKVLLGNKTDLPGRQITEEQGRQVAKEYGINFFETSAKDGTNVADSEWMQGGMKGEMEGGDKGVGAGNGG